MVEKLNSAYLKIEEGRLEDRELK